MKKELARTITVALSQFIDNNREGGMCMSSGECEAMEKAFIADDFGKIGDFVNKKLAESEDEDEKIRKALIDLVSTVGEYYLPKLEARNKMLAYLEKQKEQIPYIDFVIKPHKGDDGNPYDMGVSEAQEYAIKRGFGIPFNDGEVYVDERHITQTIGNILRWADDHPKEQKPISQEDMPYVTDEHFYEREPADSFKYKLAEYMTKNCTKKESPYGYSYSINSESILEMAKEELLKRGELQKPVEWSEEDEKIIIALTKALIGSDSAEKIMLFDGVTIEMVSDWLKSLRPQWKPTEEQMEALHWARCLIFETYTDKHIATEPYHILGELYDQLKKLKDGTDTND